MNSTKCKIIYPPQHSGADDPYKALKVIEAWGLGFHLGQTLKHISRFAKHGSLLEDLKRARWFLDRYIKHLEGH